MPPQETSLLVHFIGGGLGGTVGAIVTCPLEVAKTRLQSSYYRPTVAEAVSHANIFSTVVSHVNGTLTFLQRIYQTEGFLALWRGLGPTLVGVIPARAIQFSTYHQTKQYLTRVTGEETSSVHLRAAVTAGVVAVTLMNPIWFIKTRLQLQNSKGEFGMRYKNSVDCLVKVVREEGISTLYRGLSASLVGVSEGTIQWVVYERLKKMVNTYNYNENQSNITNNGVIQPTSTQWLQYFMCAASAKLLAAAITYPHEVIRTRLRESPVTSVSFAPQLRTPSSTSLPTMSTVVAGGVLSPSVIQSSSSPTTIFDSQGPMKVYKYHGFMQTARLIIHEEGMAALYSGMTAHLMRVVPNAAIMFVCYEGVVHFFKSRQTL